jgi:hypothetical protein
LKKEKESKKGHYIAITIVLSVTAITSGILILYHDPNNLMVQTSKIMEGIPNHCYVSFPDMKNLNPDSAGATYYDDMIVNVFKKGIKYPYPFLRSASFQIYLFQNCPYLDHSKYQVPKQFNQSIASENMLIKPSKYLTDIEAKEQKIHDYNFKTNPQNYTTIESLSSAYSMTLPQIVDRLFWENATNFDSCINPSWRTNSEIRQCTFGHTIFLVNLQQQLIGILTAPPNSTNHKY